MPPSAQIANVGFHDISRAAVAVSVSRETLFIHGSSDGGGSVSNIGRKVQSGEGPADSPDCTSACGLPDQPGIQPGMSTFCDSTCLPGWSSTGPRFGGHSCGANDASRFGNSCRLCYTNREEALAEDQELAAVRQMRPSVGTHVVMCSTGDPPPASECPEECMKSPDTVSFVWP